MKESTTIKPTKADRKILTIDKSINIDKLINNKPISADKDINNK